MVVSSIPGRRTIVWLVMGWVAVFQPPRPTQPPTLDQSSACDVDTGQPARRAQSDRFNHRPVLEHRVSGGGPRGSGGALCRHQDLCDRHEPFWLQPHRAPTHLVLSPSPVSSVVGSFQPPQRKSWRHRGHGQQRAVSSRARSVLSSLSRK